MPTDIERSYLEQGYVLPEGLTWDQVDKLRARWDVAPILVPLAAGGLALIMIGATIMRIRRGESKAALGDATYLALTVFVAIGRFALEPFAG